LKSATAEVVEKSVKLLIAPEGIEIKLGNGPSAGLNVS
jgi:hypothetical protein